MPSSRRTLTLSAAASASGLALMATPWPAARWAGAALGAAGVASTALIAYRLGSATSQTGQGPAFSYPVAKTVAQTPTEPGGRPVAPGGAGLVLPVSITRQVADLDQDRFIAGVAREEVAALLRDVTTNATELLRATTSVRTVMEQVARSVGLIETGSREQNGRLTEAAGHAEESAASVAVIAEEAAHLAQLARETAQAARSGAGLLAEAGGVVGGLGGVVGQSNAAMERLATLSDQIGSLVDTIAGVAKQSNLLALNAAIEAARAGANGRSFGVVAEAMRNLATQAATAAAEAGRLVGQVQMETRRAAESVAVGSQQVESGTRLMERVVTDLSSILAQTAAVEGVMVAISEHARVADDAARQLAEQISAVAEVSARATAEAERVAESSREASTSVKAIAHVSRHYAQVPEQVRASLVPLERTLAEVGALVTDLSAVLPDTAAAPTGPAPASGPAAPGAAGAAGPAAPGAVAEVSYADWQPWENCRTWWHLDRFMAEHPQVRIKHLLLHNADFSGQLALPEAPDVTWAAPDWAPQLLQPVDDLIERDRFDLSSFVPGVVESLQRLGGGRIYGLPMHLNMPLMVYNKNLFERAGVPVPRAGMTWEELLPGLEQIKQRCGVAGIEIDMRNAHFLPFVLHFLTPAGAPLMSDDGSRVLRSAAVEQKLQFLYDLARRELLVPYEQLWAPVRPFVEGQAAVLIGSTATLLFTPIREMAARGELSFTPEVAAHPTFAAHPGVAPAANFHLIGIHRFARNREAAWQLLQHLITNPDRMRGDILRWGQAPVQYDKTVQAAYAELGRQGAPTRYQDLWQVKTAPLPAYMLTPGFRRLEAVAGHEMALLLAGQQTPAELMKALMAAMERK